MKKLYSGIKPSRANITKKSVKKVTKETKDTKTVILYILDESGSMAGNINETISGFNEYVKGIKESKLAKNIFMSFSKFNTTASVVHNIVPIADVPELNNQTYRPHGWTALYDSVGMTVRAFDDVIKAKKFKDFKVLAMILTDGQENSSREYTQEAIRNIIKEKQGLGNWTFTYLGADQAAWIAAAGLGISRGNTVSNYNTRSGVTVNKNTRARTIVYAGATGMSTTNFMSNLDTEKLQTSSDIPVFKPLTTKKSKKATK